MHSEKKVSGLLLCMAERNLETVLITRWAEIYKFINAHRPSFMCIASKNYHESNLAALICKKISHGFESIYTNNMHISYEHILFLFLCMSH